MERFEDEFPKNLYVIRRKLAVLRKPPGYGDWQYDVGNFRLSILPAFGEDKETDCLLDFEKVDVSITERNKNGNSKFVTLREDSRFKNYEPVMYDVIKTPNGIINMSNGHGMPIPTLLELIKYLHRLTNLTAFM